MRALSCRVERDPQEAAEFADALLTGAFHDIRRHGHRGSDNLTSERGMSSSTDSSGDVVGIQGHRMGLLPDQELFEVRHAARWRGALSRHSPSYRAEALNPAAESDTHVPTLATLKLYFCPLAPAYFLVDFSEGGRIPPGSRDDPVNSETDPLPRVAVTSSAFR